MNIFSHTFGQAIKMSFQNLARNTFLSVATTTVIAILLLIFNIILGIQNISQTAVSNLSEKIDLVVYLKENIDPFVSKNLVEDLKKQEGVKDVIYTSKEQALALLGKTHPQTVDFFTKYNLQNPLPASIQVITTSPNYQSNIETYLQTGKFKDTLSNILEEKSSDNPINKSVIQNLKKVSAFTNQVIFWLIIVFIFGATLIFVNTIHINIFTKRTEISVMKLIGAKHSFIKLPFVLEGLWYSLGAIILSTILLILVSFNIVIEDYSLWHYFTQGKFLSIYLVEILITIAIGALSSWIAVHNHIKGKLFVN